MFILKERCYILGNEGDCAVVEVVDDGQRVGRRKVSFDRRRFHDDVVVQNVWGAVLVFDDLEFPAVVVEKKSAWWGDLYEGGLLGRSFKSMFFVGTARGTQPLKLKSVQLLGVEVRAEAIGVRHVMAGSHGEGVWESSEDSSGLVLSFLKTLDSIFFCSTSLENLDKSLIKKFIMDRQTPDSNLT